MMIIAWCHNVQACQRARLAGEFRLIHFGRFWGAHGSGYMALAATAWVPMGAQLPVVSPNDHPNPSQWRPEGPGKSQIWKRPKTMGGAQVQSLIPTPPKHFGRGGGGLGHVVSHKPC